MVRGALEVVVVVVVGPCSLSWGIDCVIDRLHSFRLFRGSGEGDDFGLYPSASTRGLSTFTSLGRLIGL